jgi:hypothetical protein
MKICRTCKLSKELSEFGIYSKSKDGYCYSCKQCVALKTQKWRADNPEKRASYEELNKEKIREYGKSWRLKNKDYATERAREWRYNNKTRLDERKKKYYKENEERIKKQSKAYRDKNSDRLKIHQAKLRKENPGRYAAYTMKRKAAKLQRTPKWANLKTIQEFYENCPKGMTVDHIIPLQGVNVSGLHVENNLQYLTPIENSKKSNKYTIDNT